MEGKENNGPQQVNLTVNGHPYSGELTRDENGKWSGELENPRFSFINNGLIKVEKGVLKDGALLWGEIDNGLSTYAGAIEGGKRSGEGELRVRGGTGTGVHTIIMRGEFKDSTFLKGTRRVLYNDGSIRSEEWHDEEPSGQGRWDHLGGYYKVGKFVDDELTEGNVRMVDLDGSIYEGGWKNGRREGYGKVVDSLGNTYRGDWKNGHSDGWGWLRAPSGDYWRGKFVGGNFTEGKVRFTNPDGSLYEGKYSGGKYEGYGKLTYSNGCSMEGMFEGGMPRDIVLERKLPDGRSEFSHIICDRNRNVLLREELEARPKYKNGKLDFSDLDKLKNPPMEVQPIALDDIEGGDASGEVRITYGDGSVYTGEVNEDYKPNGTGTWTGPGEESRGGTFEKGRFIEGDVVMKLSKNITYRGKYKNGEFDGYGTLKDAKGEIIRDGTFENGKFKDGKAIVYNINGTIYDGLMKDGVADGLGELLYSDGERWVGNFARDIFSGGNDVRIIKSNGSSYEGAHRNGGANGHGLRKGPGGDYENGQFVNGSFSGNGKVRKTDPLDGSVYEGRHFNKLCHGYGKITFKNGCSMEGMFEGGLARDIVLERKLPPNGTSEFSHIIFDGSGNVLLKEELEEKPKCVDEKLDFSTLERPKEPRMVVPITLKDNGDSREEVGDGEIKITYTDDSVYVGEVNEGDRPNGRGKWIGPGGESREGIFKDGKFESGTVVMKLSDNITYRGGYKNGSFDGEGELKDKDGKYYKKGKFENNVFLEGTAIVISSNGSTYDGPVKDGKYSGQNGKLVHLNGNYESGEFMGGSLRNGKIRATYSDGSSYDGEYSNGVRHGYGIATDKDGNTREGEFLNDNPLKVFSKVKSSNLHYYQIFDNEGRLTSQELLPKAPVQVEDKEGKEKRFEMNAKREPIWEEKRSYDSGTMYPASSIILYLPSKDGSLEKTIEIDFNKANALLNGGRATDLEGLLAEGALVVKEGGQNLSGVSSSEIRGLLTEAVKKIAEIRAAEGADGFDYGNYLDTQTIMLSMIEDKNLKNLRFFTKKTSYTSMTSFLESIGMDKNSLEASKEDHIVMYMETDRGDHAVCSLVNLKRLREVGWDKLNTSNEILIGFFDSSRAVGSKNYGGSFGEIGKNFGALGQAQQDRNNCWFQALVAGLAALENPEVVGRVLSREIPTYGPNECVFLRAGDIPSEFTLKQIPKLQEVADALNVKLKGDAPLVENIILGYFKDRIAELADGETLLAELDDRIEWAFEVFEKKLKELDGTVELEGEEYRKRKEEITKEYKVELSKLIDGISGDGKETPLTEGASEKDGGKTGKDAGDGKSEDKAKERPKLIKNLKTFVIAGEKINKQANDLASRLKLTLDKFREAKEKAKEEGKEAVKSPEGGENKNFSVVATLESFFESPGEVPSATLQLLPNLATALRGVKTSPTDPSGPPPQSQQNLPKNSKNTENKISEI